MVSDGGDGNLVHIMNQHPPNWFVKGTCSIHAMELFNPLNIYFTKNDEITNFCTSCVLKLRAHLASLPDEVIH